MQAAHRSATSKLQDANVPQRAQLRQFVGEMQHAVDHRVLGKERRRPLSIRQEKHGARRQIRERLNLVQEFLELAIGRGRFLGGNETVDDE